MQKKREVPKNEVKDIINKVNAGELTEDEALPLMQEATKGYVSLHLYPNRKERRRIEKLSKRKYEGQVNVPLKANDN